MVRPMQAPDKPAVMAIVRATEFFFPSEIEVAEELIDVYLENPGQKDYHVEVIEDQDGVAGYMTWGPTPLTEGAYDIYWMAVSPKAQGRGYGKQMIGWVEATIAGLGGRLIIIETAGKPMYEPTRGFYLGLGYKEVARIPDYYKAGDDRVIYTKHVG
jgi:ribosomal protein S18 acetylase RimI-like enzyme